VSVVVATVAVTAEVAPAAIAAVAVAVAVGTAAAAGVALIHCVPVLVASNKIAGLGLCLGR
jgi:hypothetical protein